METATITLPETQSAVIQELLRGQDSAKKLRDLLSAVSSGALKLLKEEGEEGRRGGGGSPSLPPATAQDLVGDVLRSFNSTLSILNCGDLDEFSQVPPARHCKAVKPEESEESSKSSATRGRRGCYKRRKSSDSWMTVSPNFADDGHQWRKYGQKSILNTNFPRSYFRCTHKPDQGCRATKQVQKTSNDPPMFQIIYSGKHTCRNLLKAPQIITADSNPQDSSILLSFKTNKLLKGTNGRISSNTNIHFSTVKSETKDDIKTNIVDVSRNQSSSTEYDLFPSPDFTILGSTIGSDQGEALSSSRSFHSDLDLVIDEVDFENMFACPSS